MKLFIGSVVLVACIIWLLRKAEQRRIREAYRFNPKKHGAAEWSTVDDVRKGGLL
jgi:hypothetical protein